MSEHDDRLAPGELVDGRYRVETLIGRGGMAAVYRVRHVHLDTLHALKVLTVPHGRVQERLMKEGRVQAALSHPNIVRVTDVVWLDGGLGLILEYVRGPSLEDLLLARPLTLDQIDAVVVGVLDGVAAAHAQQLIHRDLKPANVMLALQPGSLLPKVADFGLVKLVVGTDPDAFSKTRSGATMGTPAYMAPEQIRDAKTVDARADVWSLGAILFELVTGERAFDADDIVDLFVKVTTGQRASVTDLRPDLPERMVRAIDGALTIDADDRIPDVAALREVWLEGAVLPTRSPWDAETLAEAIRLGAGGDSTEAFLERSFRSGVSLPAPPSAAQAPTVGRDTGHTFVPEGAAGPTAVPAESQHAETVPRGLPGPDTLLPPDDTGTLYPSEPGEPPRPSDVATRLEEPPAHAPALPLPEPIEAPRRSWLPLALVALGVAAVATAGGLGVGALGLLGTTEPDPPAVVAPDPVPVPVPVPAPVPEEPPAPAPAPAAAPEPRAQSPEPRAQSPAPQAPSPEPAPAPQPQGTADPPPEPEPAPAAVAAVETGSVRIQAPEMSVFLVDASGRRVDDPSSVEPGTYEVLAYFTEGESQSFGTLTVAPGGSHSVTCSKSLQTCKVK